MNSRISRRRSIAVTLATTTLIGLASLGMAQQASAATVYVCNNGYANTEGVFDLSYNSDGVGAEAWFGGDVTNYAGTGDDVYVFQQGGGAGEGQAVKNNAAWGANSDLEDSYTVYYNSGYLGAAQVFYPVDYGTSEGNLDATLKNNEASQYERVYV